MSSQEVAITVGDTSGFVFAGERQATVSILPGQDVQVNWTMVAYNAGLLTLPDVQVASARYSARMKMGPSNKVGRQPCSTPLPSWHVTQMSLRWRLPACCAQVFVMPKEIRPQAATAAG